MKFLQPHKGREAHLHMSGQPLQLLVEPNSMLVAMFRQVTRLSHRTTASICVQHGSHNSDAMLLTSINDALYEFSPYDTSVGTWVPHVCHWQKELTCASARGFPFSSVYRTRSYPITRDYGSCKNSR